MPVSLGAGVDPTEGHPTKSYWEWLCVRGHGECGLPETGTKRKPLDQSEVAPPVIRERITVDE